MQDHVKSMVEIFDELAVIGDEIEEERIQRIQNVSLVLHQITRNK